MKQWVFLCSAVAICARAAAQDEIPLIQVGDKPFVQVRVGESQRALEFMLDSGAGSGTVLDRKVAAGLGLRIHAEHLARVGAGEGTEILLGSVGPLVIKIGLATVNVSNASSMPLSLIAPYEGRRVDGLLGRELFEKYVVEIDYRSRLVRLHSPTALAGYGKGAVLEMRLVHQFMTVEGEIQLDSGDCVQGQFIVDTGMRGGVILTRPFAAKHFLEMRIETPKQATIGGGLAGEMTGKVGRVPALRLGPITVRRPLVALSDDRDGVLASGNTAGILGGGILSRYRVIFNRRAGQLILEPGRDSDMSPRDDVSGMFVIARGSRFSKFTVMSVLAGSPAAEAGLARDDVITAVDGRAAASLTLDGLRQALSEEGRACRMEFEREGRRMTVTIRLRRPM